MRWRIFARSSSSGGTSLFARSASVDRSSSHAAGTLAWAQARSISNKPPSEIRVEAGVHRVREPLPIDDVHLQPRREPVVEDPAQHHERREIRIAAPAAPGTRAEAPSGSPRAATSMSRGPAGQRRTAASSTASHAPREGPEVPRGELEQSLVLHRARRR